MTVGMRKAFAKSEMEVKVKKNKNYFLYCLEFIELLRNLYKMY